MLLRSTCLVFSVLSTSDAFVVRGDRFPPCSSGDTCFENFAHVFKNQNAMIHVHISLSYGSSRAYCRPYPENYDGRP